MISKILLVVAFMALAAMAVAERVSFKTTSTPPERHLGDWRKAGRAVGSRYIPINILLKQRNLDVLERTFWERTNPKSSNYAKWLKKEEIMNIIAPAQETQSRVVAWLEKFGVQNIINRGDYIRAFAQISVIENLLDTEFYEWIHNDGSAVPISHGSYSLPPEIAKEVDFVTGLAEFPVKKKVKTSEVVRSDGAVDPGVVVPSTIQSVYNIPSTAQVALGSQGVAEFQSYGSFNPGDLSYFLQQTGLPSISISNIVGPFKPNLPGIESQLDIQYILASGVTASSNTTWFWTTSGWMIDFASDLFSATQYPLVVSMSWGWTESAQCQITSCTDSQDYVNRTNTEFMKIGLKGITLLASSGDQGAPGDSNPYCITNILSPLFPSSSPYVLSVGATMLTCDSQSPDIEKSNSPVCSQYQCASCSTEAVCSYPSALITTGGGFSGYVNTPAFQQTYVQNYLNSGVTLPPSNLFNANGRGAPDVSALGHNYFVVNSNTFLKVDGTSCSAPVWAGIVALFNEARLQQGKSPLGYINQLIYTMYADQPSLFNDITTGNNRCTESCCATYGYNAAPGWDPVTGLGTPNVQQMIQYISNMSN